MGKRLRAADIPAGSEGIAYAEIEGKIVELFYAKKIEATIELNKADIKTLGTRITQKKVTGSEATGSMTVYYVTSVFRNMVARYNKEGYIPTFKLVITNEDRSTTIGKQTTVLYDCMIDSATIALLDVEADALEEDIDFTYGDFDIQETFTDPVYTD